MQNIIAMAIATIVLGLMFTGAGRALWQKTKAYLNSDGPDDGGAGVPLITQPVSWYKLTDRKQFRESQLQLADVRQAGQIPDLRHFADGTLPVYYDPTLPLARSASCKPDGYFTFHSIVGHPVAIAVFAWIVQELDRLGKPGIRDIQHLGCFNRTANPDGWHNFGLALDIPIEYSETFRYHVRKVLKLMYQYCDQNNYYWAGAGNFDEERISTCKAGHDHHLHLEITPDGRAWTILNHVNLKVVTH